MRKCQLRAGETPGGRCAAPAAVKRGRAVFERFLSPRAVDAVAISHKEARLVELQLDAGGVQASLFAPARRAVLAVLAEPAFYKRFRAFAESRRGTGARATSPISRYPENAFTRRKVSDSSGNTSDATELDDIWGRGRRFSESSNSEPPSPPLSRQSPDTCESPLSAWTADRRNDRTFSIGSERRSSSSYSINDLADMTTRDPLASPKPSSRPGSSSRSTPRVETRRRSVGVVDGDVTQRRKSSLLGDHDDLQLQLAAGVDALHDHLGDDSETPAAARTLERHVAHAVATEFSPDRVVRVSDPLINVDMVRRKSSVDSLNDAAELFDVKALSDPLSVDPALVDGVC